MPLYTYVCKQCGEKRKVLMKIGERAPKCSVCKGEMEKQIPLIANTHGSQGTSCSSSSCSSCSGCST
ncbi:MAG: zinc ribbon domain-containing protein [Thermotogae bacterium]|nr:zinc ribbon domain-containing protein [Thermotogaceae bacterium]RKX34806.1 MAG: zinc ribbon domain-containing protein [Thermotogota bacterium]